jgi:hypothetical protein
LTFLALATSALTTIILTTVVLSAIVLTRALSTLTPASALVITTYTAALRWAVSLRASDMSLGHSGTWIALTWWLLAAWWS